MVHQTPKWKGKVGSSKFVEGMVTYYPWVEGHAMIAGSFAIVVVGH